MRQVIVNDTKAFGDYRCHAENALGTLDRTITLQQGEKPEKPKQVELRGYSSDTFDVDVGAIRTSKTRHPMDINGYRFEIISVAEYRQNGGKWDTARVLDLGFEDGLCLFVRFNVVLLLKKTLMFYCFLFSCCRHHVFDQ